MTERLAATRAELDENELQRRKLFADITHELATPLTSIRGYAETLLDPGVPVSPEERTHYVRGLLDESRRMDLLIRDLFELARLEANAAPLTREMLDAMKPITRTRPPYHAATPPISPPPPTATSSVSSAGAKRSSEISSRKGAGRVAPSLTIRIEPRCST